MSRNEIEFKILLFCAASLVSASGGLALTRWGVLDRFYKDEKRVEGLKPGRLRLHIPRGFRPERGNHNPVQVSFRKEDS